MTRYAVVVCFFSIFASVKCASELTFPTGFKWGAATAAYQVEGAWNISDKSPSIWDTFTHASPGNTIDGSDGDVACESYNLWERDIEIAKEMGLHFYRFSISWPRLLPSGFDNKVSEDGKRYYSELIQGLLDNGIEPIPTLYHWDLPQNLQDLGGWSNPLITQWFEDYAGVVFSLFADKIKTWLTINEPMVICHVGYSVGLFAPGLKDRLFARYLCSKHVVVAHAKAYRLYERLYKKRYNGKISIANHYLWMEASSPDLEELAEAVREYSFGMYSHPIYSEEGGWPPVVERQLAENSRREGYPRSRLPPFSNEEKKLVRGTYDFLGFNHYSSRLVVHGGDGGPHPFAGAAEFNVTLTGHPDWETGASFWFLIYPEGIRWNLRWLKQHYGDIEVMITENGYSDRERGDFNDYERIKYYQNYLKQILLAIKEDGVNVTGYTAWTLIDNFEWYEGYTRKFGFYNVDFSSPGRERTPRLSAEFYKNIIRTNSLDGAHDYHNDEL